MRWNNTCGTYQELPPIDQNLQYDFNFQQFVMLPYNVTVFPVSMGLYIIMTGEHGSTHTHTHHTHMHTHTHTHTHMHIGRPTGGHLCVQHNELKQCNIGK